MVKMAKIVTVYILPLIIGVLMCEVGEFSFLVEEGCEKTKIEKSVLMERRLDLYSSN